MRTKPVNAGFGFEIAVSVVAGHVERNALHARFFARLIVENLFLIAAPVAPAQVHAQQDFGPVLRLGAAGAGMKRDDGVAPIVRPAEQLGQLGLRHLFADARDFGRGLGERIFTLLFFGDVEKEARLFQIRAMLRPTCR